MSQSSPCPLMVTESEQADSGLREPGGGAILGPIKQLACYSVQSGVVTYDTSSLQYFDPPPERADLRACYHECIDIIKRSSDMRVGHPLSLDNVLEACLKKGARDELMAAHVVTWRGILRNLMLGTKMALQISYIAGILFIHEKDPHPYSGSYWKQVASSYHGYAFEAYCTKDPAMPLSFTEKMKSSLNSEWCNVVTRTLGTMNLVFAGEVDCVRDQYTGLSDTFMELKSTTSAKAMLAKNNHKWYLQSHLMGTPEMFIGYCNAENQLVRTESIRTEELLSRNPQSPWKPREAIDQGYRVLLALREFCANSHANEGAVWDVAVARGRMVEMPRLLSRREIKQLGQYVRRHSSSNVQRLGILPAHCVTALTQTEQPPAI